MALGVAWAQGDTQEDVPISASALDEVVEANNVFALGLYDQLRDREDRLCFSPCSIFAALSMLRGGAQASTGTQLEKALCFQTPPENLHGGLDQAVAGLVADSRSEGYQVSVSNFVYGQKGSQLASGFLECVKSHYQAEVLPLDFIADSGASIESINRKISRQSRRRIKDMICAGMVDPLTEVVLVNTVRLKVRASGMARSAEDWGPSLAATESRLHLASHEPRETDPEPPATSRQALSLVLFLTMAPQEGPQATGAGWQSPYRTVALTESGGKNRTDLDLQEVLQEMKATELFTQSCDLSNLDEEKALYVGSVRHSAWFEETVNGTEAVAATVIVLSVMDPASLSLAW
jgi:serpin B